MKYFVFLALCVVLCNAQNSTDETETPFSCTPSELFKKECNSCRCGQSGTWAECDVQLCDPEDNTKHLESPKNCKDKDRWNDGCNNCFCSNGIFACTLRDCYMIVGNQESKAEQVRIEN